MEDQQPSRADLANLYLASLQARLEPEKFRVLHRMFIATLQLVAERREGEVDAGLSEEEAALFTDDLKREHALLVSMVVTGSMDHRIVEDEGGRWVVVDGEVAGDPEKLREMREWAAEQRRQRAAVAEEFRGIAVANGLDAGDGS